MLRSLSYTGKLSMTEGLITDPNYQNDLDKPAALATLAMRLGKSQKQYLLLLGAKRCFRFG